MTKREQETSRLCVALSGCNPSTIECMDTIVLLNTQAAEIARLRKVARRALEALDCWDDPTDHDVGVLDRKIKHAVRELRKALGEKNE